MTERDKASKSRPEPRPQLPTRSAKKIAPDSANPPGGNGVAAHATTPTERRSSSNGAHELPHRAQMEAAFGQDFSSVQAFTGQHEAMKRMGASAAAHGSSVAFADASPSPWLVAHELAHVVQNQQTGDRGVSRKALLGTPHSAAEREADAVADRVASGEPAGEISARPEASIQRFAPVGHRQSTVESLKGSFSAQEIGDIYASNWERDFSQGNPDIASAVIAWTAVKNHASKHHGDPGPAAATFQAAVWKVVHGSIIDAVDESLGTYKYWEHMDRPDGPDKDAAKRWANKTGGLAGYIADSKAYIKDQIVAAIDLYRELHHLGAVGGGIDNWHGVAKPKDYVASPVTRTGDKVSTRLPANFDDKTVASRDPIREETATEAAAAGARSDPKYNAAQWKIIGQHLGRAMHPFQDFWSHSNWLELAKAAKAKAKAGETPLSGEAANRQLKSGTFAMPAKAHALGHKLLAFASALQSDFQLLLRVYGRTTPSTKLDSKAARSKSSTGWGSNARSTALDALLGTRTPPASDRDLAYGPLKTDSWSTVGEIADVADAANNVEELVLSGKYKMEDFLGNQSWLQAVIDKAHLLIQQGDENSDEGSHGKLAKDQHEGDGHKDFATALALAKEADRLVFAPLRAVMDDRDAAKALAEAQKQLALIDTLLQAPTPSHPLWPLVPDR